MLSHTIAAWIALGTLAAAHMAMVKPCTRYTPRGDNCPSLPPGQQLDYSLNAPLARNAPLCKHTVPYSTPVANWTAGQTIQVAFDRVGAAAHGGGHCQFSVSYDGGKTFAVVHEVLKHCFFNGPSTGNTPAVLSYTFSLPSNLPSSDKAVFAWSWVNAIGVREFYMNCADVAIRGSGSSYTGKQMVVANIDGYPEIEEFGGNYDTGLEYYKNAKSVTVAPST
ncbi:hypothetical protein H4R18_005842 [Coemansia javaensis]|uniref:Chitin-binding type-4 domain-containing protein n=1 Tax=Coemansia javaensis TaxID=2761396 RepID=A0A9W8LER0_9FUNG|nr:hypothetical protein H4R18_005842 [Coemansia javaensis]